MKKLIALISLCSLLLPLHADWGLRIDVDGAKTKIPLKPAPGFEDIVRNYSWGNPQDQECRIFIQKKGFKDKETVTMKAGFVPASDGKVKLILNGCYIKRKMKEQEKAWVDYLNVTAEGAEIRNGDFSRRLSDGSIINWALNGAVPQSGKGVTAWNIGSAVQTILVKKDVPVILTVTAKKGIPDLANLPKPPKEFKAAGWELTIDGNNGIWRSLRHEGKTVFESPSGKVHSMIFNSLKTGGTPRLVKDEWDPEKGELILTARQGDYEIRSFITFGEYLKYHLELTNSGTEIGKITSVNYNFLMPRTGRFLMPRGFFGKNIGYFKMFENPEVTGLMEGVLKDLPDNFYANGVFDTPFVFYELEKDRTLTIISDTRFEACRHSLRGFSKIMSAGIYTNAAGWALPGKTMHFGPQYFHISKKSLEKTLESVPHQWYTKYNYLPPADRPAWVKKSAMYCTFINNLQGCYNGAAGAEAHLLPRIKALGFNLIWIQPVEVAVQYGVMDYYKTRTDSGTWEEYHHLVDAAHKDKIRVLLDITPHGARPEWAKTRNLPPEVLIVNENGNFRSHEAFDYSSPIWREYIRKVVEFDLKATGVDGFRVDTGGSSGFNWRREGFPAKPSSNVDAEWFYREIAKNGGKIRGIEYDKASYNFRQGPTLLMDTIRKETKKAVRDGIAAAETEWLSSLPVSDFNWDFYFRQFRFQMHLFSAEEFSRLFLRWLHEQYLTDPPGTIRLRAMELPGYYMPTEFYLGDKAACAARSVLHLIHGIPMSLMGDGTGHGVWTRKWLQLRAMLPEITDGKVDYSSVKSDPQMVTIAHTLPAKSSVGVVSFYPEKQNVKLDLPETLLPFAPNEEVICRDAITGKTVAQGTRDTLKNLTLEMKPFGSKLLVFRRGSETPLAFPDDSLNLKACKAEKPQVTETGDEIRIGSVVIDRKSGLLKRFGSQLGPMYRAGDKPAPAVPAEVSLSRSGESVKVTARLADAVLSYEYDGKNLNFEADLLKADPASRSGFLFAFPNADRYQIDGVSGRQDDIYLKEQPDLSVHGTYDQLHRRLANGPVLWDSELRPLSPDSPELRFYSGNRSGLSVHQPDPLTCLHDSFQLLDRGPEGAMLHLAAWQCNPGPLSLAEKYPARKLRLCFSDAAEPVRAESALPSGIELDHQSLYWKFSTPKYTARIYHTGGMLKELTFAGKTQPLTGEQHAYSTQGKADYYTKTAKRFLSSRQDAETGSRLYLEDGVLKLRFLSILRDGTYWGVIIPPFWIRTEYEFAPDALRQTLCSAIENGNLRYCYSLREKNESGKTTETPLPVGTHSKWASYCRLYSASGIQETEGSSCRTVKPIPGRYYGMYVNSDQHRTPFITAMRIPGWWFDLIFQSNTRLLPGIKAEAAIEFLGGVDWGHYSVPVKAGPGRYRLRTLIRSEKIRKTIGGKTEWLGIRAQGMDAAGKNAKWEKRFSFPEGPDKTETVEFEFEVPKGGSVRSLMVYAYRFYDQGKVTVDLPELIELSGDAKK